MRNLKKKGLFISIAFIFLCGLKYISAADNNSGEFEYALTEASKQFLFGNYREAMQLYQRLLVENEKDATVNYQLSLILRNVSDFKNAEEFAYKAFLIDPKNKWYLINLAEIIKNNESIDRAIELLKDADNNDILVLERLITLYIEDGKIKKAEKIIEKLRKEGKINESIAVLQAMIYKYKGNQEEALSVISELRKFDMENAKYIGMKAEYLHDFNENEKAQNAYDELFELDPNNINGIISYFHFCIDTKKENCINEELDQLKERNISGEDKINIIKETFRDSTFFLRYKIKIKDIFDQVIETEGVKEENSIAEYFLRIDLYRFAKEYLLNIEDEEEGNPLYWHQLLFTLKYLGDTLFHPYSEKALNYFPKEPLFLWFRSMSLYQNEGYRNANILLKKAYNTKIPNENLRIQIISLLAEINEKLRNFDDANKYFKEAINIDKNNYLLLNNYSYYLALRNENLKLAEEYSRKTIKNFPKNSTYLDTYAWIVYRMDKKRMALKYIKRALKFGGSDNKEIVFHYGEILNSLGKCEEATDAWKNAINLGYDKDIVQEKIDSCK